MLRIRLNRVGKRGKPSYRIVVAEANAPRDGAYLEWIGNYDPMTDPPSISLKTERANDWLSKGAQPSDAVRRILEWDAVRQNEPAQAADGPGQDGGGVSASVTSEPVAESAELAEASVEAAPSAEGE